jgi:hypothetical protein
MDAFTPYRAAIRQEELLCEAENRRLVKAAGLAQPIPAWRRNLGGMLASAARSVDPSIEAERTGRTSAKGRGARAIAA